MKPETRDVMRKVEGVIPPFYVMDALFPVLVGGRARASFPSAGIGIKLEPIGDFDQACQFLEGSREYQQLEGLQEWGARRGYAIEPHVGSGGLHGSVYLFTGKGEGLAQLRDLYRQAHREIREGEASQAYLQGVELDGELLGMPACCTQRVSEDVRKTMDQLAENGSVGNGAEAPGVKYPGDRAKDQLDALAGVGEDPAGVKGLPMGTLFSYYTMCFLPCRPGCAPAGERGRRIHQKLWDFDPFLAELYAGIVLQANAIGALMEPEEAYLWADSLLRWKLESEAARQRRPKPAGRRKTV